MLPSATEGQMMSIILTTSEGGLILIDGGRREDAVLLLDYMKKLTGSEKPHIDAIWFTHPHYDHIGAFIEMVENHAEEFDFDALYYCFPSEYFLRNDDSVMICEFYRDLPGFVKKAHIISDGDRISVAGADFRVLFTVDASIKQNRCNNSSAVFRIEVGGKSILITGDCGIEAGNKIIAEYGSKIKSDICQMAHHGQSGADFEFYKAVSPSVCLWCTPGWLWNNDVGGGFNTHIWQTVTVREWMESLGVKDNYVTKDGLQVVSL